MTVESGPIIFAQKGSRRWGKGTPVSVRSGGAGRVVLRYRVRLISFFGLALRAAFEAPRLQFCAVKGGGRPIEENPHTR